MSRYALMGIMSAAIIFNPLSSHRAIADESNPDYAALEKAVLDGKDVHMVVDLSACQVHGTDKSGPPIKGSRRFDGCMIQPDGTIAFSATHFTVRPDKTPVNELLSYRVRTNGKVEAHVTLLNPATFAVLQEAAFDCDIGKGATFHW